MEAAEWDARYGAADRVWSEGPNALVEELVAPLLPGTAVDLAAGEGRHAVWLASRGWTVTAVDFSPVGLERGRAAAAARGVPVRWVVADVRIWTPPAPVDLVLVAYLQLPGHELEPLLRALPGWVAPGGTLLVLGHDLANIEHGHGGPADPDVLYTCELLGPVAAGLEIQRLETVERSVPESPGRPALDTLLVARRPRRSPAARGG